MKIVLLTTAQPSINPRLVKEADALTEAGYLVKVLYCYRVEWATELDKVELIHVRWSYSLIGGSPKKNKLSYHWTRLRRKLSEIFPYFPLSVERSICQAFDELLKAAIREKADLYIAHTPGALPVAARAANFLGKRYAFDAEDFHTGELSLKHPQSKQIQKLEGKLLPKAAYITAASPLIAEAYEQQYSLLQGVVTINNVFPLYLQPIFRAKTEKSPLRLFWFSQTLGRDRGLEEVLEALSLLDDIPIEIGLLGNCTDFNKKYFLSFLKNYNHQIEFLPVRSQMELVQLSATYDIGLALERSSPLNRDICLTNKLFTYLLSGNAILASETRAQKEFLRNYPQVGYSYPQGGIEEISKVLRHYWEVPEILEEHRKAAWSLAREKLNWDVEKKKIINIVKIISES